MTAEFSPASQTLSQPGMATFLLMVHNTGNTEDSYSATIMGTNGPVTATLVGLDGSPTQSISTFILPGLSTGAIELEANIASLGKGTVTVNVQSLTHSAITASPVASVTAASAGSPTPTPPSIPTPTSTSAGGSLPESSDGPQVTDVLRYGYHDMPTTIVLTVDQALNSVTADDPKNYRIIGPEGRIIRVKSAVYDATNDTVTLRPRERINIHHRYTLIVDGTKSGGVTNMAGHLLDSTVSGEPGSNYRTALTWRNLVLDPSEEKALHHAKTTNRSVKVKSEPAAHVISHKTAPFARPRAFRR